MKTAVVGCNHRTAPLALRERLAFTNGEVAAALTELRTRFPAAEAIILSTCNRTEIYLAAPIADHPGRERMVEFLTGQRRVNADELADHLYYYEHRAAIRHLFHVVCSLDSMVIGESQILAQAKSALDQSVQQGCAGGTLNDLFQRAFSVAKEVHTTTRIGEGRVSVASIALDFARQIFSRFTDKTVVLVGAGKVGAVTLKHMQDANPRRVIITNRTPERALELAARLGAETEPFERLPDLLATADIVITCTGSAEPIITGRAYGDLPVRRRYRPLLLVDLAVPRDVDSAFGQLQGVFAYNIDDLQAITGRNHAERRSKVVHSRRIVEERVDIYLQDRARRALSPLVSDLRRRVHAIAHSEWQWLAPKLKSCDARERQLIEQMINRMVNKILHDPVEVLNEGTHDEQARIEIDAVRRLFKLNQNA